MVFILINSNIVKNCIVVIIYFKLYFMDIFVANLNPSTKKEDLIELFSKFGNVISAKVIMDKHTGNSKRYGFVGFNSQTEIENAIKELNNFEFQGNKIIVKASEPKAKE